jgi:hypothetical protein
VNQFFRDVARNRVAAKTAEIAVAKRGFPERDRGAVVVEVTAAVVAQRQMFFERVHDLGRQLTGDVIGKEVGELSAGHDALRACLVTLLGCQSATLVSRLSARFCGETGAPRGHRTGMNDLTKTQRRVSWALQILVAAILAQTLFFKFTAAEESVYIFTAVHAEPWGRIGSGVIELLASICLLTPSAVPLGAILTAATMSGAILSHLTVLGISVMDDGGLLFGLAVAALVGSLIILALRRSRIPVVGRYFELAS